MENDYIVYESKDLKFSGKIGWKKFDGEVDLIQGRIFIKGDRLINKERNLIAANITAMIRNTQICGRKEND